MSLPIPEGALQLTIPAGSTAGRRLRLKGKGIPGNPAGDLYAVLGIVQPAAVSEAEKEAYRALSRAFDFNARA